ncbi:hypothetical protein F5Y05DRAFT_413817 [Hypoxylon sp. FL0543]|nr:hypothetical protein F5Y05DRAFT_413817 [Hypoxylon sp. FL0543]
MTRNYDTMITRQNTDDGAEHNGGTSYAQNTPPLDSYCMIRPARKGPDSVTLIWSDVWCRSTDLSRPHWTDSFDYVHQALVALAAMVKRSDWIELVEHQFERNDGEGPAFEQSYDLLSRCVGRLIRSVTSPPTWMVG